MSKKYEAALALIEKGKTYSVAEAVELVKKQILLNLMAVYQFLSILVLMLAKLTNNSVEHWFYLTETERLRKF